MRKSLVVALAVVVSAHSGARGAPAAAEVGKENPKTAPRFDPASRSVSTWREEAVANLDTTADEVAACVRARRRGRPRCLKLNNYWCVKSAGWDGEIAVDGEGHVAFASAVEGAAVAALLLKRYYVDFDRKTARAIIAHWAPAGCNLSAAVPIGGASTVLSAPRSITQVLAPRGIGGTLRARWLASHTRGFAAPIAGRKARTRRSRIADPSTRLVPTPSIADGVGARAPRSRPAAVPMTLDALMMASPGAPPSRSMIGMPRTSTATVAAGPGLIPQSCSPAAASRPAGPTRGASPLTRPRRRPAWRRDRTTILRCSAPTASRPRISPS